MIRILSLFWLVILLGLVAIIGFLNTDVGTTSQTHPSNLSMFVSIGVGVLLIGALAGIPKKSRVSTVFLLLPFLWLVLFVLQIFFPALPFTIRFF
jgi:hypothetical protein